MMQKPLSPPVLKFGAAALLALLTVSPQALADTAPQKGRAIELVAVDDRVNYPALLETARAKAAARYASGEVGRLAFFSPESLRKLKRQADDTPDTEDPADFSLDGIETAPIIDVRSFHRDRGPDADAADAGYFRYVARALGTYQSGGFRPAALEAALQIAMWRMVSGHDQDINDEEKQRQQMAFLSSGRLNSLSESIANRTYRAWNAPADRFTPDGALISVVIGDDLEVESLNIEHSTGREEYDLRAIDAIYAISPLSELLGLQPWLKEAMQTLLFSFGQPPASPEEFRRRQNDGELAMFRERFEQDLDAYDYLEVDYYDIIMQRIERELAALNASRWTERLERDAELVVSLNIPLGVVKDVQFRRGSGDIHFDRIAIQAVDNASPFRGVRHLTPTQQESFKTFIVHIHPQGVR